jgi:hypothetical protein
MITLNLTLDQINTVLGALGAAPYIKVADVIDAIRSQATPQVEAQRSIADLESAVEGLEPVPA